MLANLKRVQLAPVRDYNNNNPQQVVSLSNLFRDISYIGSGADGIVFSVLFRDAAVVANVNGIGQGYVQLGVRYAVKFLIDSSASLYTPEIAIGETLRRSGLVFENCVNTQMWLRLRLSRSAIRDEPSIFPNLRAEVLDELEINIAKSAARLAKEGQGVCVGAYLLVMELIDRPLFSVLHAGMLSLPSSLATQSQVDSWMIANLPKSGIQVASILAQVVAGLVSIRRVVPTFSHGDLHSGNVGMVLTPHYDYIVYGLPRTTSANREHVLVVPLASTENCILKLLDFGRATSTSYFTTLPKASPPGGPNVSIGDLADGISMFAVELLRLTLYYSDRGNWTTDIRSGLKPATHEPSRPITDMARTTLRSLSAAGVAPAWVTEAERVFRDPASLGVAPLGYSKFMVFTQKVPNSVGGDSRISGQLQNPDYPLNILHQMPLLDCLRCDNSPVAVQAKIALLGSVMKQKGVLPKFPVASSRILVVNLEHAASSVPMESVASEISTFRKP